MDRLTGLNPPSGNAGVTMPTTMQALRQLPYPGTYMPAVAGPPDRRRVLLASSAEGPEGIALRPFLLCQDWDQRVVIHWEDDHGSTTYTVSDVIADTPERFEFVREDPPGGTVTLRPLSLEEFETIFRQRDDAQQIPRFGSEEQYRRWFLSE